MPNQASSFIWYNADHLDADELKAWLLLVKQQTGQSGELYVRLKEGKTTYMETYSNVSEAVSATIEDLAATCSLFTNIERRCESFRRIDKV
jgi:hypothetical protein